MGYAFRLQGQKEKFWMTKLSKSYKNIIKSLLRASYQEKKILFFHLNCDLSHLRFRYVR